MVIDLPKDATGREIPLDTKTLYGEDGKCFEVDRFVYCVRQTIPGLKWEVILMTCIVEPCTTFYLTPPEPPDSWEALEADLVKASTDNGNDAECNYFGLSCCAPECPAWNKPCFAAVTENILDRIRKLRGEDR